MGQSWERLWVTHTESRAHLRANRCGRRDSKSMSDRRRRFCDGLYSGPMAHFSKGEWELLLTEVGNRMPGK